MGLLLTAREVVDERFHIVKQVPQFYKNKGTLELIILYESREGPCLAALFFLSPLHFLLSLFFDAGLLYSHRFIFCRCFLFLLLLYSFVAPSLCSCHFIILLLLCYFVTASLLQFFCRCFIFMLPLHSFCCPFTFCYQFIFFSPLFFSRLSFSLLPCFVVAASYFCCHCTSLFCHQSQRRLSSWSI